MSWRRGCWLVKLAWKLFVFGVSQSPLFSADFTPAAAPTPFETGNSFCFAKVTGLKEAAFLRAAGCSCPLLSSAALRSALLVSVSDTLMLSARLEPSIADVLSSDLVRKIPAVLDWSCGLLVGSDTCTSCQNNHEKETMCPAWHTSDAKPLETTPWLNLRRELSDVPEVGSC
jgi:hypothetical protein